MALFDGLSFSMAGGMLFLLLGLAGACRRVHAPVRPRAPLSMATTDVGLVVLDRWYVLAVGLIATGLIGFAVYSYPGVYTAQTTVVFLGPTTSTRPNAFSSTTEGVIATAGLVERLVNRGVDAPATTSVVSLVGRGVREGSSVELPNEGGQWAQNFSAPELRIQVAGPAAAAVAEETQRLVDDVRKTNETLQTKAGVAARWRITTEPNPPAPVVRLESGHRKAALAVTAVLGTSLTLVACVLVDLWMRRRRPEEFDRDARDVAPSR